MPEEKELIIFYSWQSDLPQITNQKAIRNALRFASSLIEETSDIRIVVDEATRGESGSPNIPVTILQKISICDIFVCDLTTINPEASEFNKKTPNPNVLFELGYAVSTLGWGRVIMLFNKHFGVFPDDLPFDVDRHRASSFMLSEDDPKNKSNVSNLQVLLKDAINLVIQNNPKRPSEMRSLTPEEIKRIRDSHNLTRALSTIHIPTINKMAFDLPYCFSHDIFYFLESFRGIVESPLFHIYDDRAKNLIKALLRLWNRCLAHHEQYQMMPNQNIYIFVYSDICYQRERQEMAWNEIKESCSLLKTSLDQLLEYVRNQYIEIDIEKLSGNAWGEYIARNREMSNKHSA